MAFRRTLSVLGSILILFTGPMPAAGAPRASHAGQGSERAIATRWLRGMTLRDKIAQLIVAPCFGEDPATESADFQRFAHWVRDLRIGGFVVLNRVVNGSARNAEPHAVASFLNRMQRLSKVPLVMAGDFERGASMRISGTAKFPHQMAYGAANDPALTRELGALTAREARAMGIHWVFAPDADVNNNPDNPIINTRSFGEDPAAVARNVRAYIEGAHSDPKSRVLLSAKHFPGHGDTSVDSHLAMPVLEADRARIEAVELPPFRAAIQAGVDSVMTAHLSVPALDREGVPATVSPKIVTTLLRGELKFRGIAITDAMDMQGLARQFPGGEAAVRALEAGIDVLLMPPDPDAVIRAVESAVQDGRLSAKRIEDSARKMLEAKARVGLHQHKLVDIERITDTLEAPEFAAAADRVAQKALTLVRNQANALPLRDPASACFWILSESRYGQGGRRLLDELRAKGQDARTVYLDPQVSRMEIESLLQKQTGCGVQVMMMMASGAAYKAGAALPGAYGPLLESLRSAQTPVALVAVGSPYVFRVMPDAAALLATFSASPTAEAAAVRALFGDAPVTGRMPVSIPGIAKVGEGITVPASGKRQHSQPLQ